MKKLINCVLCLLAVFFCCATASAVALDTTNLTVSGNTVTIGVEEDAVLNVLHQSGKTAKIAIPYERQEDLFIVKDGGEIVAEEPEWLEKDGKSYIRFPVTGAGKYEICDNHLDLTGELAAESTVWIDGVPYPVLVDGSGQAYVEIADIHASLLVTYSDYAEDAQDKHTQYPTGMRVWKLSVGDGGFVVTEIPEFTDLLRYSGCSIRVTGKKGIRMITSIGKDKKADLVSDGLAGYTLKEYGTVVAWASQLSEEKPLVMGKSYVKSNYAYKKYMADPIFAYDGDQMQYTNVLVGFSLDQCRDDIAMRPYMILENTEGLEITLYGGIVQRSIGYIAKQNANTFDPTTQESAYNYVWDIIHHVYGEDYVPSAA